MEYVSEKRFTKLEDRFVEFKDETHKNDITTVEALTKIAGLLDGLQEFKAGLSRKGAIGYGGGTATITVIIIEVLKALGS